MKLLIIYGVEITVANESALHTPQYNYELGYCIKYELDNTAGGTVSANLTAETLKGIDAIRKYRKIFYN